MIDTRKLENIEIDGIDMNDYPEFCDAFISYAEVDGVELTDEQLEEVNDDTTFVYNKVMKFLY